jgi:4-diphosphocytidyl-2-C-methyl-D-erythritol kinase
MWFNQRDRLLVVQAPAKLNLFLEILAKRADGYHELETLMVCVGVYDTLSFMEEVSGRIRLNCFTAATGSLAARLAVDKVPDGEENLVVRAAQLLRNYVGVNLGVRIELRKRIPAAAGLAGGSSDAAATLMALNRFWNLKLPDGELWELGSQIGSDVPFFLSRSAAAIGRGRGELIEPVKIPLDLHFVIACPDSGLPTALVYRFCRPAEQPRSVGSLVDALSQSRLARAAQLMHNALQSPAEDLNRDVALLCQRISRHPVLGHMMSGSGTACFGLCASRRQAMHVAARLKAARVGRVFVVQSRS